MLKRLLVNKILTAIVIAAIAGGGYWSYKVFFRTSTTATQYVTKKVEKGTIVVSATGSGQISSSNQTSVTSQISGTVLEVLAKNNEQIKAGDVIARLQSTNEERAVRNARASLQSAELSRATLEQAATTSSILQARSNVIQAQQSLQSNQNSLVSDYNSAYTDTSNTFVDLAGVMTGLNNILYGTSINKVQGNVDAYSNMIAAYYPNVSQYNLEAATNYGTALSTYNQNLSDFKNTSIYSSTSSIESLVGETYTALKTISAANASVKNLLDLVSTQLQQNNQKTPPQLMTDESNMQSYITTTNSHLATLLQRQNSIQTDKQAINSAGLSIAQSSAALTQLLNGPTDLAIQSQELSVTQARNSLADAEQNLSYDSVRAPFSGIITNIIAKPASTVGASTVLATLLSNEQLAQATFNEVDIVNIKVGQKATITFDALPNVTLTGKVSQVDTIGTVSQGVVNYNVQVALDVPNAAIKPGMSNTIAIVTNVKQDVLVVPNSAVSTKQGSSSVQVMAADGTVAAKDVTIGVSNDTMTEIVSGVNEGDDVVTKTITGTATTATPAASGIRIPGLGGIGGGGGIRRGD